MSVFFQPEPPSTNKWQLDKWLNKVNPHSKALIHSQPESHGPGDGQAEDGKGKPPGPLAPLETKDRALLSPVRDKAKPRTGQKPPEGKSARAKSPASGEPVPLRRSTGKKQPRKAERTPSVEDPHGWPKPSNPSAIAKEKEPPPPEPTKGRGKGAPRKEPRSTATAAPPTTQDKKKHRGPSKIVPKSKEFIETESSSSECHSDPEELAKVPLPCPGPIVPGPLKSKDCSGNILSVSSLASTSSASIPDPGATDLLDDSLFSPIPMAPNELLSPLRDLDEVKSLWVKIELSFLTRVPGRDPPEPVLTKPEPRDPVTRHRRQSPVSTPVEKPPSKSKRKHKASCPVPTAASLPCCSDPPPSCRGRSAHFSLNCHFSHFLSQSENCEPISGTKKSRLESSLQPPCISPVHSHKFTSTKE